MEVHSRCPCFSVTLDKSIELVIVALGYDLYKQNRGTSAYDFSATVKDQYDDL